MRFSASVRVFFLFPAVDLVFVDSHGMMISAGSSSLFFLFVLV